MEFLRHSAPRRGGSGPCNFRNALPHCLGSVGGGTPTTHCVTAWGQWAVEPLKCTASLPGGSDQLDSCGVVWCGVVWCGVVWCGVVWCGVVWCGVVWCGVVWCGVVWCGVVCRRRCYQKAKAGMSTHG